MTIQAKNTEMCCGQTVLAKTYVRLMYSVDHTPMTIRQTHMQHQECAVQPNPLKARNATPCIPFIELFVGRSRSTTHQRFKTTCNTVQLRLANKSSDLIIPAHYTPEGDSTRARPAKLSSLVSDQNDCRASHRFLPRHSKCR